MAQFIEIPLQRLPAATLRNLLEEYASRDGTDYGEQECSLEQKVASLQQRLLRGELRLLYDNESEHWDLASAEQTADLLHD